MNLVLFSKLLIVGAVWVSCLIEAEANIAACSPSNTNIVIDAQVPGEIATPIFPDGSRDISCIWKIQAPTNFRLEITIETLKLNGADDYLTIRDGTNTISPLIGKYGPCARGSLTLFSSGRSAFLQTVSAVFSVKDKLRIAYRPTNPDDIDCSNGENPANFCGVNTELRGLSGVISSPNFPNNYGAGRHCLWTIVAPPGYRVQFAIHWFGIEDHRYSRPGSCGDDRITVSEYRGNYTNDMVLLCGCKRLFAFVSYMEKMWLEFSSYKKNNWPGFYATYKALAPEECPAGSTDCFQKNTAPIGFNAQGQVCRTPVRTSSQVATQETSSLLLPSSVKSLAIEGSATSSQTQVIKTTVHPTLYESNSSNLIPSKTSGQRTTMREMQTQWNISSSIMSRTFVPPKDKTSAGSVKHSSEVIMHTFVSSLRSSNMKLATIVSSSPSTPEQTLVRARSSFNVSGTSFAMIEDSNSIPPIGQLKSSREFTTSIIPRDVIGTSVASKETEAIKASPSIAPSQNKTTVREQTVSLRSIVTTGVTLVSGGTRVKGPSLATNFKTETIGPSASTGSYQKETLVPQGTEDKRASTAAEYKTKALKTSASSRSDQSAALETKNTAPVVPTSSLARPKHVNSQSTPVNPASESKNIKPSETSKKTSSGPSSTPVEQGTTQYSPGTGTDSLSKGIEVKCKHYAMEITISRILRPYLVISSLHLQDPTCKVSFSNDTHALLRAPLEECDTQQKTSEDYFIYLNTMTGDEKTSNSSAEITRKGRMKFEFQCSFKRLHVLSIVSYSPRRKAVRTADDGVGNFTFEMDMFKDPKYDIVVNQYPVTVHSGQPMYLQVNAKSRDRSLLTFLEECWVTPTSNPRDQTRHTIIEKGCSRDASLQYLYKKSPLQKFTFKAFRFRDVLSRRLYVHCEVVTCRRSDSWSVCERGCKEDRRHRRENKAFIMDKDVFLSLGPVKFQGQGEESDEPVVYVKALTGVLGALALILLIAVVILILRRRNLHEKKNNTWILLATREHSVQEGKQTDQLQIPQAEM